VARRTHAVVTVANHQRAPRHEITLYENDRRHWLALTYLFQIVSNMPLVRRQQGQIARTQNIFRNVLSPRHATSFGHEAPSLRVAELKGQVSERTFILGFTRARRPLSYMFCHSVGTR
jgi:hypothetical protein